MRNNTEGSSISSSLPLSSRYNFLHHCVLVLNLEDVWAMKWNNMLYKLVCVVWSHIFLKTWVGNPAQQNGKVVILGHEDFSWFDFVFFPSIFSYCFLFLFFLLFCDETHITRNCHFNLYNSPAISVFTMLCNHLSSVSKLFHPPRIPSIH